MNRLTRGEKIFGASALLLLVLSFFSLWAKLEVAGGGSLRFNAWDALPGYAKLGLFLAIIGVIFVLVRAAGSVELPIPAGLVYLIDGGVTALVMLIAVIAGPADDGAGLLGFEVSRGPFLFVGLLLGLGMAYGGWLEYSAAGGTTAMGGPAAPPPSSPPPPAS